MLGEGNRGTVCGMETQETIQTISPIFAAAGAAWYFLPETLAAGKEIGLDGLRFYFMGRGGTLGDVDWRTVASAFGYFKPALIERMWTTGQERCPVAKARDAHLGACAQFGRTRLTGLDLGGFCEAAELVVTAACNDPGSLPLFAAYAGQALPQDEPARASQLIATLRELRGSVHLACVVAAGLPTAVAHALRRPSDVEAFGWGPGEVPEPTEDDRRKLSEADRMTDQVLARHYQGLSGQASADLVAGARAVEAALSKA